MYHTDWKDKLNNTETIEELSIYPTNPCAIKYVHIF